MELTKEILENAVKQANTIANCLQILGMAKSSGAYKIFRNRIKKWNIDISHFASMAEATKNNFKKQPSELKEIMIEKSTYSRGWLKHRLLKLNIKTNKCELCGQTDIWQNKKMHLILDHINGVSNDHRLENLRIICPNCDATLETFGGKNVKKKRSCKKCGSKTNNKFYCSTKCSNTSGMERHIKVRKVERPSYEQLLKEIEEKGYLQTSKKYGVSDNTIRKWVKFYEKYGINQ